MIPRTFTPEGLDGLVHFHLEGVPNRKLAEHFDCDYRTVQKWLRRQGYGRSNPLIFTPERLEELIRLRYAGATPAELARHFGCTPDTAKKRLRQAGHGIGFRTQVYSQADAREMLRLYRDEGMKAERIGKIFACSPGTVREYLHDLDPDYSRRGGTQEDLDEYRYFYHVLDWSTTQIAAWVGLPVGTVRYRMKAAGIRFRSRGEVNRLAWASRTQEEKEAISRKGWETRPQETRIVKIDALLAARRAQVARQREEAA